MRKSVSTDCSHCQAAFTALAMWKEARCNLGVELAGIPDGHVWEVKGREEWIFSVLSLALPERGRASLQSILN